MEEDPIKVVLADDHSLVRDGMKALLEEAENITVIGEAENGKIALDIVDTLKPDILIIDIRMPVMTGIECVKTLTQRGDATKALVLSMHDSEEYVLNSIAAGAYGYLLKDTSREELLKAIKTINTGEKYFSADVSPILVKGYLQQIKSPQEVTKKTTTVYDPNFLLTKRQRQILSHIISGMSNKEIAEHLGKSVRTIETHRFSLMKKLEVKNLIELKNKAESLGLI